MMPTASSTRTLQWSWSTREQWMRLLLDSGSNSPNRVVRFASCSPAFSSCLCSSADSSIVRARDSWTHSRRLSEVRPKPLEREAVDQIPLVKEVVLEQGLDLSLPDAAKIVG